MNRGLGLSPLAGQAGQILAGGYKPQSKYQSTRAQSGKLPQSYLPESEPVSNVYAMANVPSMPAAGVRLNPRFNY